MVSGNYEKSCNSDCLAQCLRRNCFRPVFVNIWADIHQIRLEFQVFFKIILKNYKLFLWKKNAFLTSCIETGHQQEELLLEPIESSVQNL